MSAKPALTKSGNWTAKLHHEDLKVTGHVTLPTPGYIVTLTKKVPQGINPHILLLDMSIVAPHGVEPQHVVTQTVTFEEHTKVKYQEVDILPEGIKVSVTY